MVETHEDFEQVLATQIHEQKAALEEVATALLEDAENTELIEMQEELAAAVHELEATLLDMKRSRLLEMLDQRLAVSSSGTLATELEPVEQPASSGVNLAPGVTPGAQCRFRYMDGRWYDGLLDSVQGGSGLVHFLHPTRSFMLVGAHVPCSVILPPDQTNSKLLAGASVLVLLKDAQLWEPASVVCLDSDATVRVKVLTTGQELSLPRQNVVSQTGDKSQGLGRRRRQKPQGSSSSLSSDGSDEEDASSEEDKDDVDFYGASGSDEPGSRQGLTETSSWEALGSMMEYARVAAEAGPQTETAHFAEWEMHSRGIASKLLAKMGYRHGEGLGTSRQGIAVALEASVLPARRGLGAAKGSAAKEGKKRKKSRGGEKARKRKMMEAAWKAKEQEWQEQLRQEAKGGAPGLFAFINNSLGDGSEAASRIQAHHSRDDVRSPSTPSGSALKPPMQQGSGRRHSGEESRRQLMNQQDEVAALQFRVGRLKEMLQRNKENKGLRVQIEDHLKSALHSLSTAQAEQARVNKIISSKESQKKWLKF